MYYNYAYQNVFPTARANMAATSYLTPAGCWRVVIGGGESSWTTTDENGGAGATVIGTLPLTPAWFELQESKYSYTTNSESKRVEERKKLPRARTCFSLH
jgi:hypothetical protein